MKRVRLTPANHWDWSIHVPFSQGLKTDDLIYVGGQISADAKGRTIGAGDIAAQTRNTFEFIKRVLEEGGGGLEDIVKLNTYYQHSGEGADVTRFWEEMTAVRKEYLADPGPVGTAVRVRGFAYEGLLIEIEAIAVRPGRRKTRLMPANHWDWSMPVPFSQGWKVGDLIFLGGQISSDSKGRTIGAGDIATQTRNVFEFIHSTLREGGADLGDLIKLNTYYQFEGEGPEITRYWEDMTRVRMEYLRHPGPAGTAVRVDGFAFEDLLIEIEGFAYLGQDKKPLTPADHWDWSIPVNLSQGWRVGNLVFVGGQISADAKGRTIGAGDIATQTRNVFENIDKVLREAGATMESLVRMNTYFYFEGEGSEITRYWEDMTRVRMEYLPDPGPVGTAVRVNGFAYEDLLIEVEAIADLSA